MQTAATKMDRTGNGKELKWVGKRPLRPDGVDKVTGRAKFGADLYLPGMIVGKVLRSPHPHARIRSIDTSKAEALPGVKAVVTRDDFHDLPSEFVPAGDSGWGDGTLVLGVEVDGESRAYPVAYLNRREMVIDEIGGTPLLVSW